MAPWNCVLRTANLVYITSLPGTPENTFNNASRTALGSWIALRRGLMISISGGLYLRGVDSANEPSWLWRWHSRRPAG